MLRAEIALWESRAVEETLTIARARLRSLEAADEQLRALLRDDAVEALRAVPAVVADASSGVRNVVRTRIAQYDASSAALLDVSMQAENASEVEMALEQIGASGSEAVLATTKARELETRTERPLACLPLLTYPLCSPQHTLPYPTLLTLTCPPLLNLPCPPYQLPSPYHPPLPAPYHPPLAGKARQPHAGRRCAASGDGGHTTRAIDTQHGASLSRRARERRRAGGGRGACQRGTSRRRGARRLAMVRYGQSSPSCSDCF